MLLARPFNSAFVMVFHVLNFSGWKFGKIFNSFIHAWEFTTGSDWWIAFMSWLWPQAELVSTSNVDQKCSIIHMPNVIKVEQSTLHYKLAINNDKKWFGTVRIKIKLIMLIDVDFWTQHDHPTHASSVPQK